MTALSWYNKALLQLTILFKPILNIVSGPGSLVYSMALEIFSDHCSLRLQCPQSPATQPNFPALTPIYTFCSTTLPINSQVHKSMVRDTVLSFILYTLIKTKTFLLGKKLQGTFFFFLHCFVFMCKFDPKAPVSFLQANPNKKPERKEDHWSCAWINVSLHGTEQGWEGGKVDLKGERKKTWHSWSSF